MKIFGHLETQADVAIIGGGIAGCMAAIRAAELVDRVVMVEKCDSRRSGCATTGVDHIWTYVPDIHGPETTVEDIVKDHSQWTQGFLDQGIAQYVASHSHERILDLERFGVRIRDESGKYRFVKKIHRVPNFLHFAGRDLKLNLTREVKKRKVRILNRVMAIDLVLEKGQTRGLIGIGTRDARLHLIKAKAVILSTGNIYRLYRNPTGIPFNIGFPPHETGGGHALAFRAGAELQNMEFTTYQTGPKYFQRCGRGSYSPGGRIINALSQPLGKTAIEDDPVAFTQMDRSVEEEALFFREIDAGRGPLYMDCSSCSDKDMGYIHWALSNEGNVAFLRHLDSEAIDLRKQKLEFTVYEPKSGSGKAGLWIDQETRTSLPGLFAAGDVIGVLPRGVMPAALTLGWKAGETASQFAIENRTVPPVSWKEKYVEIETCLNRILSRKSGAPWQEAQLALQNIMTDYAGRRRSETMLSAGLSHLKTLQVRVQEELKASNPHELYRCLEVLDLVEMAETIMASARERRETRFFPEHYRVDYPQQDDDHWNAFLVIRKQDKALLFNRRQINNTLC